MLLSQLTSGLPDLDASPPKEDIFRRLLPEEDTDNRMPSIADGLHGLAGTDDDDEADDYGWLLDMAGLEFGEDEDEDYYDDEDEEDEDDIEDSDDDEDDDYDDDDDDEFDDDYDDDEIDIDALNSTRFGLAWSWNWDWDRDPEARGRLCTEEEAWAILKQPLGPDSGLSEEVLAILADSGADTMGKLLAQLAISDSRISKERGASSLIYRLGRNLMDVLDCVQPVFPWVAKVSYAISGGWGIWREVLLEAALDVLPEKKRAAAREASADIRREMLAAIGCAFCAPAADPAIFPSETFRRAMHWRWQLMYSAKAVQRQFKMTEQEYRLKEQDFLRQIGQLCVKTALKAKDESKQTRKKMRKPQLPWFCVLLQDLYPDICGSGFFEKWDPPMGLKWQEQVIESMVRSAGTSVYGSGDGELLLGQYRGPAPSLESACETCGIPVWEAADVEKKMREILTLPRIRNVMLWGFPDATCTCSSAVKKSRSDVPLVMLELPFKYLWFFTHRFQYRTALDVSTLLYPEPLLKDRIPELFGREDFFIMRAVALCAGLGPLMKESAEEALDCNDYRTTEMVFRRSLVDDSNRDDWLRLVELMREGEDGVKTFISAMVTLQDGLLGWDSSEEDDPLPLLTREEYELISVRCYYYGVCGEDIGRALRLSSSRYQEIVNSVKVKMQPLIRTVLDRSLKTRPSFVMGTGGGSTGGSGQNRLQGRFSRFGG